MSTPLAHFFGSRIFVINRAARTDRWAHVKAMMAQLGITNYRRFEAHEPVETFQGLPDGNHACVSSHRDLLAACAINDWPNMLVLEDDFSVLPTTGGLTTQGIFNRAAAELPPDWDMLYLGGGYGSDPQYRHSRHLVRINTMMTTSSYAVTGAFARRLSRHIHGHGPIDSLLHAHTPTAQSYCITPRLFAQWTSYSDLTNRETDYTPSMTDPRHEEMLVEGDWVGSAPPMGDLLFRGPLMRQELAGPHDMDGTEVIVGREGRFRITKVSLLDHPAPWRYGEIITYHLQRE